MKFKYLVFATVSMLFSVEALAIAPGDINFGNPDFTFYISGQPNLPLDFIEAACSGDMDVYVDDPSSNHSSPQGVNWRAVYCTMNVNPDLGPLAGAEVLWVIRHRGGSDWGVYPIDNNYYVEQMNIFSTATWDDDNNTSTKQVPIVENIDGDADIEVHWTDNRVVTGECPIGSRDGVTDATHPGQVLMGGSNNSTICVTSHGGISDLEPAMYASGTPSESGFFPPQNSFNNLNPNKGWGVVYQPVITEDVWKYLQSKQLDGTSCDPNDPSYASPVDWGMACQPSMTKAQITTLLQQTSTYSWATLFNDPAPAIGYADLGLLGICRRVNGTATQAAYYAYFMGDPCRKNPIEGGAIAMVTQGNTGLRQTVDNLQAGNVSDCMNAFFNPVSSTVPDILSTDPARGAFGVQKVGWQPNHAVAWADPAYDHWGFVKVDDHRPSDADTAQVDNVIRDGQYNFYFENSFQYNNQCNDKALGTEEGACFTAMNFIAANLATDDVMSFRYGPYGNEIGVFAIDGVGPAGNVNTWHGNSKTDGGDAVSPINAFRVSRAAHKGNSCRPTVLND